MEQRWLAAAGRLGQVWFWAPVKAGGPAGIPSGAGRVAACKPNQSPP